MEGSDEVITMRSTVCPGYIIRVLERHFLSALADLENRIHG